MKLLNSIGKALFGMPPPLVKDGDLFFELPACVVIRIVNPANSTSNPLDASSDYILRNLEGKGGCLTHYRIQKIGKLSIGDKLISQKGVIKTIENMADIGVIAPYKENWYKILPL